jgi:hypothetical protein
MNLELDADEEAALRKLLRDTVDGTRFFLSPRLLPYKSILAKMDPTPSRERQEPVKPQQSHFVPQAQVQKIVPPHMANKKRNRWPGRS